ncbi:hypothetical protein [Enterococcus sp. LJL51]|uniref:hypothetical protein n=1 Tax=Enterococcus sp. LJL51 TaxID=3416656 RepID=UPI003CFB8266
MNRMVAFLIKNLGILVNVGLFFVSFFLVSSLILVNGIMVLVFDHFFPYYPEEHFLRFLLILFALSVFLNILLFRGYMKATEINFTNQFSLVIDIFTSTISFFLFSINFLADSLVNTTQINVFLFLIYPINVSFKIIKYFFSSSEKEMESSEQTIKIKNIYMPNRKYK